MFEFPKMVFALLAMLICIAIAAAMPINDPSARAKTESSARPYPEDQTERASHTASDSASQAGAAVRTTIYKLHTEDEPDGFIVDLVGPTDPLVASYPDSCDFDTDDGPVTNIREEADDDPAPGSLYPFYTVHKR